MGREEPGACVEAGSVGDSEIAGAVEAPPRVFFNFAFVRDVTVHADVIGRPLVLFDLAQKLRG